jgi:hypothetical protein
MAVPTLRKKRARRRKEDKAPISTRLVLPDGAKGEVGAVSDDLFRDLFPQFASGTRHSVAVFRPVSDVCPNLSVSCYRNCRDRGR